MSLDAVLGCHGAGARWGAWEPRSSPGAPRTVALARAKWASTFPAPRRRPAEDMSGWEWRA
eukprot:7946547-Pyramimonas_sp.AAC.1